jgi:hypothetical protein
MNTEVQGTPLRSPSPVAERMRLVRKRRRQGMRGIRVWLHATQIDGLIRKGFLRPEDRGDLDALAWAAEFAISTVFDETV